MAPKPLSPRVLAARIAEQPLCGTKVAAAILGIKPANFRRDAAEKLTEIEIEGSVPAFVRAEVEALRDERAQARDERTRT